MTVATFAAAGLLRFETLGRHTAENWRHFGATQAEPDVAAGLFSWERQFYGPFLAAGHRVLVVGCGSGRDLLALLEQGCRAEGLEPVAACADMARARLAARGLAAPVYTADIATARLTGRYDVIIFSWFCYSYIPQRARRVAVLRKVRAHLAPEGRVLVSYVLARPAPRRAPWRLARLAAQLSRADWRRCGSRRPEAIGDDGARGGRAGRTCWPASPPGSGCSQPDGTARAGGTSGEAMG